MAEGLRDRHIGLVGRLWANHDTIAAEIQAAGGRCVPVHQLDAQGVAVIGERAGGAEARALSTGATRWSADMLEAALAGEHVADMPQAGTREAVGELRAAFDGPPARARWERVAAILDASAPSALPALITYARDHIKRWPWPDDPLMLIQARPDALEHEVFAELTPCGRAPLLWLGDLQRDVAEQRLPLAPALSLQSIGRTGREVTASLEGVRLPGLRALDLGYNTMLTPEVARRVISGELAPDLELLALPSLSMRGHQEWDTLEWALPNLRAVWLHSVVPTFKRPPLHEVLEALLNASIAPQLTSLCLGVPWYSRVELAVLGDAATRGRLDALRHLCLDLPMQSFVPDHWRPFTLPRQLHTISMIDLRGADGIVLLLAETLDAPLPLLDLSRAWWPAVAPDPTSNLITARAAAHRMQGSMASLLNMMRLIEAHQHISRVRLSPALLDALLARRWRPDALADHLEVASPWWCS